MKKGDYCKVTDFAGNIENRIFIGYDENDESDFPVIIVRKEDEEDFKAGKPYLTDRTDRILDKEDCILQIAKLIYDKFQFDKDYSVSVRFNITRDYSNDLECFISSDKHNKYYKGFDISIQNYTDVMKRIYDFIHATEEEIAEFIKKKEK
jgi:hypothetical protein